MEKEKSVVIFSGGLDSTTLIYYLLNEDKEVYPICFDYGQKHNIELKKAKVTCDKLGLDMKLVNLSFMKDLLGGSNALTSDDVDVPTLNDVIGEAQPITYVPNRNMMMLSIAISYAEAVGAKTVCFGAQAHDEYSGYWDTTMNFVKAINNVNKLNRENFIRVVAPFVNLSKSEEVVLGERLLEVPFEDTWTSYKVVDSENEIADSSNPTSRDRIMAFARAGLKDPQKYYPEVEWDSLIEQMEKEYNVKDILDKIEW